MHGQRGVLYSAKGRDPGTICVPNAANTAMRKVSFPVDKGLILKALDERIGE